MKKITVLFLFAAIALAACNDDDDDNGGSGGGKSTWTLDGVKYTAIKSETGTMGSDPTVTFSDANSATDYHSVRFRIDQRPTVETQYLLEATKVGGITIFASSVEGGIPIAYYSNTNINGDANKGTLATIQNTNGKLTFSVPEIWLYNGNDIAADSVRFSGTFTEF